MNTDNFSYVYMLVAQDHKKFKIGKADDIHKRIQTLQNTWNQFDLNKSLQIKCKKNDVYKIEKTLHFIFENWNIDIQEKQDGYTEWFDINCFEEAKNMILSILNAKSQDKIELIEGIQVTQKLPKKLNWWNELSSEEKKLYREEKKRLEIEKIEKTNIERAYKFIELFSKIKSHILSIDHASQRITFENNDKVYNILGKLNGSYGGFSAYHRHCGILSSSTIYGDDDSKIHTKFNCNCLSALQEYDESHKAFIILKDFFLYHLDAFCITNKTS